MSSDAAADTSRMLRTVSVRVLALAVLFGLMGEALVAIALALAGVGVLFLPVNPSA